MQPSHPVKLNVNNLFFYVEDMWFCIVQPPFQAILKAQIREFLRGEFLMDMFFFGGNSSGVAPVEVENLLYTLPETNIAPKNRPPQ